MRSVKNPWFIWVVSGAVVGIVVAVILIAVTR